MSSRSVRAMRLTAALLVGALALTGCSGSSGMGISLPTFQAGDATQALAGGPAPTDFTLTLAGDCNPVVAPADLGALLGMPLETVAVRSTVGVPAPSVGRTERLACRYTGTEGGPARGATLLDLNIGRYGSAGDAAAQWELNAGVESGERRDLMLGAAQAAVFDRARDSTLMVVHDDTTLTLVLPGRPLPGDRPRADLLVDVALRALAVVEPAPTETVTQPDLATTPTPASTPLAPPADPAVASGG